MNKEIAEWESNINILEMELNQLNQEFIEEGHNWGKEKKNVKKIDLENKQSEYIRYRKAIEEKKTTREKEIMQPIFDHLNSKIKEFGRMYNYDLIWGTVTGGNILYSNKSSDLTQDFIEFVNSEK